MKIGVGLYQNCAHRFLKRIDVLDNNAGVFLDNVMTEITTGRFRSDIE